MRIWGRVLVVGVVALGSPWGMTGAEAATPSHPGGVSDTCPEVLAGVPTGAVEKSTVPPPGSDIGRGAVVEVTLRWDPARFSESLLHKVLDCVTVDGRVADDLSVQERDAVNDGEFVTRVTVPDGLADGAQICDRGFVSGPTPDGPFGREKSNDVCFTIRGDALTAAPISAPPVTAPAPRLVAAPPVELAAENAAPTESTVGAEGPDEAPVETDVAGAGQERNDGPTLPRTGSDVPSTLLFGLAVLAGGRVARHAAGRIRPQPA